MITVEILFGEVCNLYGDPQNEEYLRQTIPDADFIRTPLDGEPYFVNGHPDIILISSMSDEIQARVINKLFPYVDRIKSLIDDGVVFLATGNACEVFCRKVENVTLGTTIEALSIFDLDVKVDWFDRYNGKILGKCDGLVITGFRSQFSMIYGDNTECAFIKADRGIGINRGSKLEGFRHKNFIGTQILGPILPLNPEFCEYIIRLAGGSAVAAHKEAALAAYNRRVEEFSDPRIKFD